jgi:hypothetical protein
MCHTYRARPTLTCAVVNAVATLKAYCRPDATRAVMTVLLCSDRLRSAYYASVEPGVGADTGHAVLAGSASTIEPDSTSTHATPPGAASPTLLPALTAPSAFVDMPTPLPAELWVRVILQFIAWTDWPVHQHAPSKRHAQSQHCREGAGATDVGAVGWETCDTDE